MGGIATHGLHHICSQYFYIFYRNILRLNKNKIKFQKFLEMDIYKCPFFNSTNKVLSKSEFAA